MPELSTNAGAASRSTTRDLPEDLSVPDALQVEPMVLLSDEARPVRIARRLGEGRDPVARARVQLVQRGIVEWHVGTEEEAEDRARVGAGVQRDRRFDVRQADAAER